MTLATIKSPAPSRCAVVHLGARLHYAVPDALARAGLLHRLYTDFCVFPRESHYLQHLPLRTFPKPLRRLLGRVLPDSIPSAAVKRYPWSTFRDLWFMKRYPQDRKNAGKWAERKMGGTYLAERLLTDDFANADSLYTHPCVATDAIREARRRGLPVIFESISHPRDQYIESAEHERFGLSPRFGEDLMRTNLSLFREEAAMATVVLAASQYARRGLVEFGIPEAKIRVVPYGLPSNVFSAAARVIAGRILFVGSVGFRKGLPSLAAAARKLKSTHPAIEIRVAGPFEMKIAQRPEFCGPVYLGQIPRQEIQREFLSADIFAFPTVSDAFGIVLMEALQAGLPIVATPNCADAVEHNVNGFRVAVGDSAELADRIVQIVKDRALRERMSRASKEIARGFSAAAYQQRLAAVFSELQGVNPTR